MKVTRRTTVKEYLIFFFASAYFAMMISYGLSHLIEVDTPRAYQLLLLGTFLPILLFWLTVQIRFVNMQNWELSETALIQGKTNRREHRFEEIEFVHVGVPFKPGVLLKLVQHTHPAIYRHHHALRAHSLYVRFNDNSYMLFNVPEKESSFMEAFYRAVESRVKANHQFTEKELKSLDRLKIRINQRRYL